MWRNLRNVNVGSAMQALGNVVAPPMEDNDEEGSYYEEEEELEEADDIISQSNGEELASDEEEYYDDEQHTPSALRQGLGLVSNMFARALDRSENEDDYEYYEEDDYYNNGGEEVVELYRPEDDHPTMPPPPPSTTLSDSTPPLPKIPPSHGAVTPPPEQPKDDGWDDIHTTWGQGDTTPSQENGDAKAAERRPSIQREAGSLSPISPSRKNALAVPTMPQAGDVNGDHNTESLPHVPMPRLDSEPSVDQIITPREKPRTSSISNPSESRRTPPDPSRVAKRVASSGTTSTTSERSMSQVRRGGHKSEQDETPVRGSSKVSLSDARFLAEPPRSDELETADRWASTSMRNMGRTTAKDNNVHASRRSLDSCFDDSSLSSLSTNDRSGARKGQGKKGMSRSDPDLRVPTSRPAVDDATKTSKGGKGRKVASKGSAEDRFRAEGTRKEARVPPLEPQRKASQVQNRASLLGATNERSSGWKDPPKNPQRTPSDEIPRTETQPIPVTRPPLVSRNSKEGDLVPRPIQRLMSLTDTTEAAAIAAQAEQKVAQAKLHPPPPPMKDNGVSELVQKCSELERELALSRKAREECEQKLKEETAAREAQVTAFWEKEARMMDAATEEREQMMREMNAELDRQVGEISSLLQDQELQHEKDREEWQQMLTNAEDQIQTLRQEGKTAEQSDSRLKELERRHKDDWTKWQQLLRNAEQQIEVLSKSHGKSEETGDDSHAMEEQRRQHNQEQLKWESRLNEADRLRQAAEREKNEAFRQLEKVQSQNQQRQDRAIRIAEEKLAQTLAILDEREEQIGQLKEMVKSMSDEVNDHREGVQEVEDEVDELRHHSEVLQHRLDSKEVECSELREELSKVQSEADKLVALKMELRMLKEDQQRERAQSQSVAENASTNTTKLSTERDAALAEVDSLRQQLVAAQADIDLAQQDAVRAQKASENLQMAMEAMQAEREAELGLLDEQRRATEEASAAAHAAALEATHEANEMRIREVQAEGEARVREAQDQIRSLEEKLETFRTDNVQMRRSLDEAISRLQHNVEDVIDRTLMKNILLDWLTKHGNKEKRQILEMMSSLLHFTDEEKARVHIGGEDFALGKVLLQPPPPPKADVEHLEGSNVQEKWVNFLLAETDD